MGEALELAQIPHRYNLVTTYNSFQQALDERLLEALEDYDDKPPILHFTMHGNSEGIELTDKTFLKWQELQEFISPIQKELGGLLICMSSCQGSSAFEMAINKDNIPFLYLVGNKNFVSWSDATVAYITFYHLLFKYDLKELEQCVDVMKRASGNNDFKLWNGADLQQDYQQFKLDSLKTYLKKARSRKKIR